MKRISAGLALCLAFSNPSSMIASPLIIAAIAAQICTPHLGKKILDYQDSMLKTIPSQSLPSTPSTSTSSASATTTQSSNASDSADAQAIIALYTTGHQQELQAMLARFTKARKAVFGRRYFNDAKNGTVTVWRDTVTFPNGAQIYFAVDQVNNEKFLTTLGLYYKSNRDANPILLQRRRIELPRTTIPKPGDTDYNGDQKYIDTLNADIQRYINVSTTDIRNCISEGGDVVANYRKQAGLIESTM